MRKTNYIGNFYRFFKYHPHWLRIVEWSKLHSLPGFKRIPIYNILHFLNEEFKKDTLITRANSMAFSFFLSIFPSIIVLVSLLPYLPISMDFFGTLQTNITQVMPGNAGKLVFSTIESFLKTTRGGVLSFGFFLAIWFASNGMLSMMKGLEKTHKNMFKRRNVIEKRLIAIQLTFILTLILFASVVFIILGNTILNFVFQYIKAGWLTRFTFTLFRWLAILSLFYTGISLIYRYGSSIRKRIPFFNTGAVLATLLSILTSWGFSFYVDNFGNFNKIYGSIGTLIVLMLWIQINCSILLIGFELNASIAIIRENRSVN
jgi:membrane protein